jgi:hypothetical protein
MCDLCGQIIDEEYFNGLVINLMYDEDDRDTRILASGNLVDSKDDNSKHLCARCCSTIEKN